MVQQTRKDDSQSEMPSYVPIVLSILLASLIVSASIFMVGNAISKDFTTGITGLAAAPAAANNPTPTGNVAPTPTPVAPTVNMAELAQNGAGSIGSENAPVVIVEYSDYQCPFCRTWVDATKSQLQTEYIDTGKVRLVWKDFPLSFHPMATPYANAARCAGEQGKYFDFHDKIFDEQSKVSPNGTVTTLTLDNVKQWAVDLGLNAEQFNSCVDSSKYSAQIQANMSEGSSVDVSGTPSFYIGKANGTGTLIVGAQPYTTFKQAIDALLA